VNAPLKIGQPRFLSHGEVLSLHSASLDAYGGVDGILDQGKLDASLAMPQQGFSGEYAHEFPFGMAAAYGFHIAMNHAFRDGNKRTAFAAMVVFLRMNGWNFEVPDEQAASMMLRLIEERRDKSWLADELERWCRALPSMELRDFFASLSPETMEQVVQGMRDGRLPELAASVDEAAIIMPLIPALIQRMNYHEARGEKEQSLAAGMNLNLLLMLFRVAEDMGYEW
jgi:death on curing protein